jgi:hypothetical protein
LRPKIKTQKSPSKLLASVFWDKDGILLAYYLQKGATIMAKYYVALLYKLKQQLVSKRRDKLSSFFKTMLLLIRQQLRTRIGRSSLCSSETPSLLI